MGVFTQVVGLLSSLAILIILHEGGHFLFARIFKTRVEKFYLFFNPWFSIFKYKKGYTEYGLGWLPLGGYVKIAGMIDESMDKEQMKKEPQPWEFRSKPTWNRLLIMLGGVIVNFVVALLIYAMILYTWGERYIPAQNYKYGFVYDSILLDAGMQNGDKILMIDTFRIEEQRDLPIHILLDDARNLKVDRNGEIINVLLPEDFDKTLLAEKVINLLTPRIPCIIDSILPGEPAEKSALRKNDRLLAINGISTEWYDEFFETVQKHKGEEILVQINRNNIKQDIPVMVNENGMIGIIVNNNLLHFFDAKTIEYGFFESFPAGVSMGVERLTEYVRQFKIIFTREGSRHVGSFFTFGSMFPKSWDWLRFWNLTAFLSIILAFINVLPIPALDGGHVMFVLYEMVSRRKPSDKFMEYAQMAGMIIILSLVAFALHNDIRNLF